MSNSVFIGIDISSQTLEIASSDQTETWQVANDTGGTEQLISQGSVLAPGSIVLEVTFEAACAL